MSDRLTHIEVSDFRSIQGPIDIDLDAQVVLIHGPNGAGKTSVMSAIELALTGSITAMFRQDPDYRQHLVHNGATQAEVRIRRRTQSGENHEHAVVVTPGERTPSLLREPESRYYTERCYLSQATLGRLLEIYQTVGNERDSPLNRYVGEILRIDRYDALIDGLHACKHVTRLRKLVPEYEALEDEIRSVATSITAISAQLNSARLKIDGILSQCRGAVEHIEQLGPREIATDSQVAELRQLLAALVAEDGEQLTTASQQLRSVRATVNDARAINALQRGADLQGQLAVAEAAVAEWRAGPGRVVADAIDAVRPVFPDLPSPEAINPEEVVSSAIQRVAGEIERCRSALARDDEIRSSHARAVEAVRRALDRRTTVEDRLASSTDADRDEDLAGLLSAIANHADGDVCPVCGRDFSELGAGGLQAHIQENVARLSERAVQLRQLAAELSQSQTAEAQSRRTETTLRSQMLSTQDRDDLTKRLTTFELAQARLDAALVAAIAGARAMTARSTIQAELASARNWSQLLADADAALADVARSLGVEARTASETITAALERLGVLLNERLARREVLLEADARLAEQQELLRAARTDESNAAAKLSELNRRAAKLQSIKTTADGYRATARHVVDSADGARAEIVSRVFNESLNTLWRSLFARLAPTEPFVPVFRVPADGRVRAILETVSRDGTRAGSPGSMLSAGNLNTAALTLFLALHLNARSVLPWLVLDDPVQSMDDVHISQFSALLRTLARDLNRQLIIAVHDRQLFEYLALELSPAVRSDSLITVELSRTVGERTTARVLPRPWAADPALSVA